MNSDFEDLGTPVSIQQCDGTLVNPGQAMEQTIAGSTPLKRMKAFTPRYRQAVFEYQMKPLYNAWLEQVVERRGTALETRDAVKERFASWRKDMRSGRLDPDEVIERLHECREVINDGIRAPLDGIARDAEIAEALITQDPADWQAQQHERFPALAKTLPVITDRWLRGEPGAPEPRLPGSDS